MVSIKDCLDGSFFCFVRKLLYFIRGGYVYGFCFESVCSICVVVVCLKVFFLKFFVFLFMCLCEVLFLGFEFLG